MNINGKASKLTHVFTDSQTHHNVKITSILHSQKVHLRQYKGLIATLFWFIFDLELANSTKSQESRAKDKIFFLNSPTTQQFNNPTTQQLNN